MIPAESDQTSHVYQINTTFPALCRGNSATVWIRFFPRGGTLVGPEKNRFVIKAAQK